MRRSVAAVSIISMIVLIVLSVFTGCTGQKFTVYSDQQYAYSFQRPSGWEYRQATELEMSVHPNGDLKQEWFTHEDGTMLQFETRIVNNYSQYEQVKTYMGVPAEELRYSDYSHATISVKGMTAEEYVFNCIMDIPYTKGSKGIMIWFSSDKFKYVFIYVAPSPELFDQHHVVYEKAIESFIAG